MQRTVETTSFSTLAQAQLRNDMSYLRLLDSDSTMPYKYVVGYAPRQEPRWLEGRVAIGVGGAEVDDDSMLQRARDHSTRVVLPAASNKPNTELFGTAPFMALGRGGLTNNQGLALNFTQGRADIPRRTRLLTEEKNWDTFAFLGSKPRVEDTLQQRAGAATRAGPVYMNGGR